MIHFCNTFDDNNRSVSFGFVRFRGKGLPRIGASLALLLDVAGRCACVRARSAANERRTLLGGAWVVDMIDDRG